MRDPPMTLSLARVGRVVRLHELGALFRIYTGEASPFRVEVRNGFVRGMIKNRPR